MKNPYTYVSILSLIFFLKTYICLILQPTRFGVVQLSIAAALLGVSIFGYWVVKYK